MKKIKWIIQYDIETSKEERIYFLSTKNKMDYICSVLVNNGWQVEIISPAITAHEKGYYKRSQKQVSKNIKLTSFSTFGGRTRLARILSKLYSVIQLFFYLFFCTSKGEPIIVTHSLNFTVPVYFAKKLKKFKLILDFNEEYNKVKKGNIVYQWAEPKIIESTDRFIFANDLMGDIYGINSKNYIVVHGQYLNNADDNQIKANKLDGKIHIVYAGIISETEKSAFRAIELAKYLDNKYIIHILGKIDEGIEENFYSCIKIANENSGSKIVYEGIKTGAEYINNMMQYDIGLNLRAVDEDYIDYGFPSKILSYLNVKLRVVSSRIKCVTRSRIGSLLYYFDDNNPQYIAEVIKSIDIKTPYNPMSVLEEIDTDVRRTIDSLILD